MCITPALRETVKFRRLNFMEGDFGMREPLDIIFCRNVIIYFDRTTQEKVLGRLCHHLIPGGYLFMGIPRPSAAWTFPLFLSDLWSIESPYDRIEGC